MNVEEIKMHKNVKILFLDVVDSVQTRVLKIKGDKEIESKEENRNRERMVE